MSRSRLLRSVVAGGAFLGLGACGGPDLPPAGPGPGEVDTGYGTRDAREVIGAVTSVSGDHYNEGAPLNLQELLRGRVAGLEFVKGPGGHMRMRIRGMQSLIADQEPLIVVDGVQISGGYDVRTQTDDVRRTIGLSGQYAAVDEHLTGFENLDMVGRLYRLGRQRSRERARELLERFDLADSGDRPV
jgi:hypothetical protein